MNPCSQSLTAEVLEKEDSNLLSHPECNIPPKKKRAFESLPVHC